MTNSQKIKMMCACESVSMSELSRQLSFVKNPQSFSQRLKTDKFSMDELKEIGAVLGYEYKSIFTKNETGEEI